VALTIVETRGFVATQLAAVKFPGRKAPPAPAPPEYWRTLLSQRPRGTK